MSKIGVFDSGVGGLSVAHALEKAFPNDEVVFINDVDHLPYGLKTPDELRILVRPHLQYLADQHCDVVVVACNTVSCTILSELVPEYDVPIIGVVPMLKPASLMTTTKKIAVCATPTTLKSQRYAELKKEFCEGVEVIEPDCQNWAAMIERNEVDRQQIMDTVEAVCSQGVDTIVLGCTHYHWIENLITGQAAGRAHILQPEPAIVAQVSRVLGRSL